MVREIRAMKAISEEGGHPYLVRFRQSFHEGSQYLWYVDFNLTFISPPTHAAIITSHTPVHRSCSPRHYGVHSIIMDYCDSGDLQQRIRQQREIGRYFTEMQVNVWFVQLTAAVHYLHHSKILHRDIKPANVFIHDRDQIKLGDLGLSKMDEAVTSAQLHTQCGSPLFLAPEVHMGREYSKSVE